MESPESRVEGNTQGVALDSDHSPLSTALLISDLHLCPERPGVTRAFLAFLEGPARKAQALYILGDLFEYWVGDDDLADDFHAGMAGALAALADAGTPVFLMVGNRDFLLGEAFAQAARLTLLADPAWVDIGGRPTLLMHGDSLCTDDEAYQAFRKQARDPAWQANFLALPLDKRRAIALQYRQMSEAAKGDKAAAIMDVNGDAVAAVLREHGRPRLMHGHTHRPNLHQHEVDGYACERWVLPDWKEGQGAAWLECTDSGCHFRTSIDPA